MVDRWTNRGAEKVAHRGGGAPPKNNPFLCQLSLFKTILVNVNVYFNYDFDFICFILALGWA